jgi:glycerate dehydrogenase
MAPPPLPPGKDKHHIVVLEAIHATMPTFDFPHTITLHPRTTPSQVPSRIKDATIVIACMCPVTPSDMSQAPFLGCLSVMAVGIGWVDRHDCARRGVTVTKCPGGNVDAVGEHFLGLYFAVRKRIAQLDSLIKRGSQWCDKGTLTGVWREGPPRSAGLEVLGIMGYGTLGKRIEKLAQAVGFGKVIVAERKGASEVRGGRVAFDDVLRQATVICLCLPLDNDTKDLISTQELAMMQSDAIVINVARGGIVNEAALATALKQGRIAGAATDVLATEPGGPGTSPLLPDLGKGEEEVPNLTVTAHIAWFTQGTIRNYQRLLKQGIEGWVAGTLERDDGGLHESVVVHGGKVYTS